MSLRVRGDDHLWSFGTIPYEINAGDIPEDSPERAEIDDAIETVNQRTNLTLVPRSNEDDFVEFMHSPDECHSLVGRRGGRQPIACASDLSGFDSNSLVHEILHAAGFYHEQQRSDREEFITIDFENIISDSKHNFEKKICPHRPFCLEDADDLGDYDLASIMHYDRRAFAKDPSKDTITPVDSSVTIVGGSTLSSKDITSISTMYPFKAVPGWFGSECRGAAIAVGSISHPSSVDLVVLHVNAGREGDRGHYTIGWNLDQNSLPQDGWADRITIPEFFGRQTEGVGATLADIDGNGLLDLLVVHIEERIGRKAFYRIGWDLDPDSGEPDRWSDIFEIPGDIPSPLGPDPDRTLVGYRTHAGVAVEDINDDGQLDIVFFYVLPVRHQDRGVYRVGFGLDSSGNIANWSDEFEIPATFGETTLGADVSVADLNGNGNPDLICYHVENPRTSNRAFYRIGFDMTASGSVGSWSESIPLPGSLGPRTQGAGFVVTELGGRPVLIYSFIYDSPGRNRGVYRALPLNPDQLPTVGTFGTDDDADLVEFVIEHDVVPSDTIEFKLELGPGITWHKGIWVPVNDGEDPYIEAHNDVRSESSVSLGVDQVDSNGSLGFQKAKFLGVITGVGSKQMSDFDLPSGSRITLTWLED